MSAKPILERIGREPIRPWLAMGLVTGVGAILRLAELDALPPGLYRDEAYNGLDALQVLAGRTPIFFEANHGREPLFIYVLAASVAIWGRSPGALRIVSALVGILTIPAVYWLGAELFDRRVGTLAGFLAATSVWTLNLSRTAFRAVALPPLAAVSLALLWRGLRQRRLRTVVWGGICYGLTFYTYLAARFSLAALLFFVVYCLVWHREDFWARGWLAFGLVSLLVVAPLGVYFLRHWAVLVGRAGQVSVFHPDINRGDLWGTIARHAWRAVTSFFVRGDSIPRHNVPLRPVFGVAAGVAFLVGVCLSFARAKREPECALVIIWLGTMLVPTILAEDAPHMLRACGVLPVLFLFPALGLAELPRVAARRGLEWLGLPLAWGVVAVGALGGIAAYGQHLHSETAYYCFEAAATQLAVEVNLFLGTGWQGAGLAATEGPPQAGKRIYIASRLWENWPSLRYLCPDSKALTTLPSGGGDPTRESLDEHTLLVLWPYDDNGRALSLLPRNQLISVQEGGRERGDLERDSRLLYVSVRSRPAAAIPRNLDATWEGGMRLLGYRLEARGEEELLVELYWQARAPIDRRYTVFSHLLRDGVLIGQHDGPPAHGYYPTDRWRVGDTVLDPHLVSLLEPCSQPECQVVVGLYRWETMQHLRLLDDGGRLTQRTSVVLQ